MSSSDREHVLAVPVTVLGSVALTSNIPLLDVHFNRHLYIGASSEALQAGLIRSDAPRDRHSRAQDTPIRELHMATATEFGCVRDWSIADRCELSRLRTPGRSSALLVQVIAA
jgi:hypothetical protein